MPNHFDAKDPHQVVNLTEFQDLFVAQARMVAAELYMHGMAVMELRRNAASGKLVRLDPIDATTIAAARGMAEKVQYEQRIGDRSTWIDADQLMVMRLDRPVVVVQPRV